MTSTASATSSETDFRLITESMDHIVWTATPDGSIEYFNEQATAFAGERRELLGGWDWLSLVHADDIRRARDGWDLAVRLRTPYRLDHRIRRVDGEYRWHAFRVMPIRDRKGVMQQWIGTATDIHDSKHVEEGLRAIGREAAEKLQLLEIMQSEAPVGFGFIDRDYRLTHMNATMAAMNHTPMSDFVGKNVFDVVPEMRADVEPLYRSVLDRGEAILDVEIDGPETPDPAERLRLLTSYFPIPLGDEIVGIGIVVVDITARIVNEKALAFQAELLAAAGQAIVAVDLDRNVIYWNRAAEEIYGWTAAEALGRPSTELIVRTEEPGHHEAMRRLMVSGRRSSADYEVALRDGRTISVLVTNTPVFGGDGELVAVIGSSIDVTERKRAEAEGRALGAIVEGSADAIWGTTDDGIVTSWNPASEQLFGFTASEIVGRSISLIAPSDRTIEQETTRERLNAGGSAVHLETTRRRKDGTLVDVLITASAAHDAAGHLIGHSVIARDITERLSAQRALEASQRRLAEAQRTALLGSFEYDVATGEHTWSDEYFRILGIPTSLISSGELFISLVHPDDALIVNRAWGAAVKHGRPIDLEYRIVRPDGSIRWVRARCMPEMSADGMAEKLSGTMMDDTDRVEADQVRRAAEVRFEIGFEQSAIGAAITDLDGLPLRVNPATCQFFERPEDALIGTRWTHFTHPDEVPLGQAVLSRLSAGHDTYTDERRYLRPDGSVVWALTNVSLVRDAAGEPEYFFVQLQDITGRKVMEQELAHQALHDTLTGLPNRALLEDRLIHGLAGSRRRGSQVGVMFLDVDQFKMVNDSMGHSAGDDLLRHIATQIAGAIRPGDTVARFGGDEFVVVCDDVSSLETEQVAERVLQALRKPCQIGTQEVHISASLGIAIADEHATPESLLRDSDAAMYRAKERGRGRAELFDEALRLNAKRRLATASALHRALDRDEFVVLYQPVVDLLTGSMVSVEALVRWKHPEHGLVTPDDFISLAEETGLIVPIGARVLEQACSDLAEWKHIGLSSGKPTRITIAVNLSVRQMLAADIAGTIEDVLTRTGVHPSDLCLELTESVFMEDVGYFGRTLDGLKAIGVDLSIDDFGTGYSSLSYLKAFPVDGVKVDRVFVDGLGTDPHDTALVAAIVAMAKALDLQVTAEGVETNDQLMCLKQLGVPRAQGFYLARPMGADAIAKLIRDRHRWNVGLNRPLDLAVWDS